MTLKLEAKTMFEKKEKEEAVKGYIVVGIISQNTVKTITVLNK